MLYPKEPQEMARHRNDPIEASYFPCIMMTYSLNKRGIPMPQ